MIETIQHLSRFISRSPKQIKAEEVSTYSLARLAMTYAQLQEYQPFWPFRAQLQVHSFNSFVQCHALTKDLFTTQVQSALSALGYNSSLYASHSFHIGAATTVAERGIKDSMIRALGRWKSDAYAYFKIPRAHLASFTAILSSPAPSPANISMPV